MSNAKLPERPSLEYLKKIAKERLAVLRASDPAAKLARAQLDVAREHGFPSWRALKADVDRRRAPTLEAFFRACTAGDVGVLRGLLRDDAGLVRERTPDGSTGLHLAARRHPDAVQLLIEHGADPNARDEGDHATPLHFAAANGMLDSVRVLLDAGADVRGAGDLHKADVIGWAARQGNEAVVNLLLERGARHHIFSAMALGDLALVQRLVEEDPRCLSRRRSRFENEHTPLHAAFAPPDGLGWLCGEPHYALLKLLIHLGADLEATDNKGRTPLAIAMLRGDSEAIRLLTAAGARQPERGEPAAAEDLRDRIAAAASSVKAGVPMFSVRDMRATVRWYESIGFTVHDPYEDGGELLFARLTFGGAELTLSPGGDPGPRDVSLWFFTDRIEELYKLFKQRQFRAVEATHTAASSDEPEVRFDADLYEPFYGGRQFDIRDPNGLSLIFWQPVWLSPAAGTSGR